ncbi:MAG TPA: helix-turn-helix domain-containing protein [Nocardioidaceae bacterium]|nr:helix-turn-helix domain-containing protein [Nocardioidaceae bacterium]
MSSGGSPHAALASPVRRRILGLLRAAANRPGEARDLDVYDLSRATGLHVTTVRFHLDVLRRAGLVSSRPRPRTSAGRPRLGFSAAADLDPRPDPYRTLAGQLAGAFGASAQTRSRRGELVGRDWAAELVADSPPSQSVAAAANTVSQLFVDLGFASDLATERDRHLMELHACPFIEVAREHPDVVCAVHRGLLRGLLERLSPAPYECGLQVQVAPDLCIAHVAPDTTDGGVRTGRDAHQCSTGRNGRDVVDSVHGQDG